MEEYLDFGGAWWGTGFKVLADQTAWSIYLNAMYSFLIGTLALRNPKNVWEDVKRTSWPALRVSWRFWPFVHCISFSHAVPLDLKLLWVDVMEIVWVTLLSRVANQACIPSVVFHRTSYFALQPSFHPAMLEVHTFHLMHGITFAFPLHSHQP
ncbi:MAG: hypothetical protein SGPRY_009817 [Prymnesium sp.]